MSEKYIHEELNLSERWDQLPISVKNLDTTRNEILNVLLIVVSIVAVLPLAASLFRITKIGWQNVMYFQIVAYLAISATTILHRRLSYQFKATVLILFCFILGCIGIANIGLLGSGILFLVFSIILATMFFGVRYSIVLVVCGLLLLVIIAYGVKQNWIIFDFSIEIAARSFSSWISKICTFALFSTILIFSLGRLINYLVDSSENLRSSTLELNKIYDKLIQEIAEKKKAEEALRESEKKLHAIFDHHFQLTGLLDTEGKILAANRTALSFAGVKKTEVMGKYFWNSPWWGRSQRPELQNAVKRAVKGEFVRFETTHLTADKEVRDIDFSLSPVRDDNGDVIFVVPEGRDITEIRRAEVERANLQEQLNQAQKMEAIGTLAGGIAHDFNNILSAVIGYSEIAIDHQLQPDAPARESIKNVLKAAFRAKNLVKQILTFSRQTEYDTKPISLAPILKEVVKMLRASLPANIEIRQNVTANNSNILGDPTQIHQVMMNLCTNAGYAMRDTGGILELALSTVHLDMRTPEKPADIKSGSYVKIEVRDTGPGMTPSVLEQVFNPFFTTKPKEEGTGLGLSVVHGIVKDHGGKITVDSQPEYGTTFTVYFPQIIEPKENANNLVEPLPMGSEHILVVDDEPDVANISKSILELLGYSVTSSNSSQTAFELFSKNPSAFDLVLTDQTMPKMTGDQLASKILSLRPDIPIVLCTGFSHLIDDRVARAMGIREFILKPVIRRDLAITVRRALDQSKE